MHISQRRYKKALIPIIAVLIAFIAFNVFCVSGIFADAIGEEATVSTVNRFFKIDSLEGLDQLKSQYFGKAVSENSFASYSGDRWVVVELEGTNLYDEFKASAYSDFPTYCKTDAAAKIKNTIENEHSDFLAQLDENSITYDLKYSYSTLNNGIAVKINSAAYNTIAKMSGVKSVYCSEYYLAPEVEAVKNNANVYTTGIYDSSDIDYKGEGMVVAILDTGLDYTHEAFAAMPDNDKIWKYSDVKKKMEDSNFSAKATADQVYYNAKVPFAYDYADDDPDVYPAYSTHGTHVAGIVAGKSGYVVNETEDEITGETVKETFLGVAPEAQLVICKVFTDDFDKKSIGGAETIDILSAVSDCVKLGVDVINMSLGTACGFSEERGYLEVDKVYSKVKEAGISLIVAASNDYSSGYGGGNGTNLASNPDSGTVGAPSTYDAALSVASINGQKSAYLIANDDEEQVAFITNSSDENGNENKFVDQLYEMLNVTDKKKDLNFKYVVVGGVGKAPDYAAVQREFYNKGNYDGVIALIKRGDTTFAEKVQIAMSFNADACIIYNNVSGTIRMSLGDVEDPVPTCSIGMDAGKILVEKAKNNVGTVKINGQFLAGPFMSEFSSWGPSPDLRLKPEISAHGGEITSAVPGGYDVYSGTSMAAPNMAGAVAILRQYLKYEKGYEGTELTKKVNQLLMSTATIARNEEGNPYSPRKQGAGLAGIADAINTESFITVLDEHGEERDKTKIELFDDAKKKGVYTFDFIVNNISGKPQTYAPKIYVMTETLASDDKTVAEKAHMLDDSSVVYYVGNSDSPRYEGERIEIPSGNTSIRVTITLGSAGRKYLDESFKNGMYVEGFVSLQAVGDTQVTIGLPYLAFYGDWTAAPLFDYDVYEIAEDEMDTGIEPENKRKASANSTKAVGLYWDDKYIIDLGAYLFKIDEKDVDIYPTREKAAISIYDEENNRTIYELYLIYAGLLRCAAYMDVEITDAATGQVILKETQQNIGKSYADGGSNRGSLIKLEIKPLEWGLSNNSTYLIKVKGGLDYPGGENPEKDSFECQFTVDYEAPELIDYRIRFEPYKEDKQTKYKIYMDVDVRDNQYVMSVMPGYIKEAKGKKSLTLLTEYPVPVYGEKGVASTVSFDITDYYEKYVKAGDMYISIYDYAMNESVFQVKLDQAMTYPDGISVATDEKLRYVSKNNYTLTLAQNEAYKPVVSVLPSGLTVKNLTYVVFSGQSNVLVEQEEIFGWKPGNATILICDSEKKQKIYATINVLVTADKVTLPRLSKISLLPVECGQDYVVSIDGSPLGKLELYPHQSVNLQVVSEPWYLNRIGAFELEYSSTNPGVADVDENGKLTTYKKGSAIIKVSVVGGNATKGFSLKVNDEFRVSNYTLYDYYGGEDCVIPEKKNVMYIDEECFKNNTTIKTVTLPSTLTQLPENAFSGCSNLESIYIPSQCIVIKKNAFSGCLKLSKITFGYFVDQNKKEHKDYNGAITIAQNAFKGCTSLKTIEHSERITTAYDSAFEGCTALEEINITELRVAGKRVFAGCTNLEQVVTGPDTDIGVEMFSGCKNLKEFVFKGKKLASGAFENCWKLTDFTFAEGTDLTYMGEFVFNGNNNMKEITLPDGTYSIGKKAFGSCTALTTINLSKGTKITGIAVDAFNGCKNFENYSLEGGDFLSVDEDGVLYNKDMSVLLSVPVGKKSVSISDKVKKIGVGALAGVALETFNASAAEELNAYAFANCTSLIKVILPSGMTELPDGIFYGCSRLTEVDNLESVVTVGKYAFALCKALTGVNLPEAQYIEEHAFYMSAVGSIIDDAGQEIKIKSVGESAFENSAITKVDFPALTKIGERAFRNNPKLTEVSVGGIVSMGNGAFANCANLEKVTFGTGTETVGSDAFFRADLSDGNGSKLTSVDLPDTVKEIGARAFFKSAIESINLKNVTKIGKGAFYGCQELNGVDISKAVEIGSDAFGLCKALTAVDLNAAETIGDYAFAEAGLTSAVLGEDLKYIGECAFIGTKLVTVTLPAGFSSRTCAYVWGALDEKGRPERIRSRNNPAYGEGVFGYIDTLKAIYVEGDGDFVSVDGVLYSKTPNGYVLEQYPSAREGEEYTVIANTVMIGPRAFEGVKGLKKVIFPYTLAVIGSYAFYNCSVSEYVFNSVEAPTLLSDYINGDIYCQGYSVADVEYYLGFIFGTGEAISIEGSKENCLRYTWFYANFKDYFAFGEFLVDHSYDMKMTIPKNGKGYDNLVWTHYFEKIVKTEEILPDYVSHKTLDAVDEMKNCMSLEDIAAATDIESLKEISELVQAARLSYNQISGVEQLNLPEMKFAFSEIVAAEEAIRAKKAELGNPVAIKEIKLVSSPTKTRYTDGESFDASGMVLKAIYEDYSEGIVENYTLDKTVLKYGDDYVTVTYIEGEKRYTLRLYVTVVKAGSDNGQQGGGEKEPEVAENTDGKEKGGLSDGAIIAISVVCGVVALAGIALAIILVLRKKKKGATPGEEAIAVYEKSKEVNSEAYKSEESSEQSEIEE